MFLVRTGDTKAKSLQVRICSEYRASDIPYYLVAGNYQELKFRLRSSELRIELYMDLIYDLCRLEDRFLGVYTGSKYLVVAKVSTILLVFKMIFCFITMLFLIILDSRISMDPLFQNASNFNTDSNCFFGIVFYNSLVCTTVDAYDLKWFSAMLEECKSLDIKDFLHNVSPYVVSRSHP
jgi:hypothetical protein